jgi:hypothetical protein
LLLLALTTASSRAARSTPRKQGAATGRVRRPMISPHGLSQHHDACRIEAGYGLRTWPSRQAYGSRSRPWKPYPRRARPTPLRISPAPLPCLDLRRASRSLNRLETSRIKSARGVECHQGPCGEIIVSEPGQQPPAPGVWNVLLKTKLVSMRQDRPRANVLVTSR